ncbi:MAG: DUF512 domain-containing protein [Oscillospiraceae bacterium]|jgi:putative radical SAM enzyme (TIGR03279 family)|nr:DUF512 domain-containing protein [Oscillospiraceae bacterium]
MKKIVKSIVNGSPASRTNIVPGDALRKINGHVICDVLDYRYYSYDPGLMIELESVDGGLKIVRLRKPEGTDLGLEFEVFLMDTARSCVNKCVFCFIDQLPDGMRETLYYKDDDARLSFLQGNYITLTNLTRRDIERIIKLRVSPINVSVHTLDPELRAFMLGLGNGAAGVEALKTLAGAGITLNCQIVCCPGINDGARLAETINVLIGLGECINSVSVVPVGLTKHRQGLAPLRPFDRALALETVRQVDSFGEKCLESRRSRVFFCADELYIIAGKKLPGRVYYEDYPQLENGVGMMRLLITEFMKELGKLPDMRHSAPFSVATGMAAAKYLTKLLKIASKKYDSMLGNIYAIRNEFFGHSVDVSGLITGGDIIAQMKGRELGSRLLIPANMLRRGEDVFLDDVTVAELSTALCAPVRVVNQDGADLLRAFLGY